VAAKVERFETEPTARGAAVLGRIMAQSSEYGDSIRYYREASRLDPEGAGDYSFALFRVTYRASRSDGEAFPLEDVEAAAEEVLTRADSDPSNVVVTARMMAGEALRREDEDLLASYIGRGLEAAGDSDDESIVDHRRELQILEALHVTVDPDRAVALRREAMPDGWTDDPDDLNGFAWWCFENEVNLEEAEQLARKGVDLSEPGSSRAMILDTVAEIRNLRGDCDDALDLIRRAIADDPDTEHYQEQETRFEECVS
jgi:tetratricopeptide (TPR) repeat protein